MGILIFIFSIAFAQNKFIIWNVGQGQWTTFVEQTQCSHFDVGGEFSPVKEVLKVCSNKKNLVYLSHWDWDHIGFIYKIRQTQQNICLAKPPRGPAKENKVRLVSSLSPCPESVSNNINLIKMPQIKSKKQLSSNDLSQVFIITSLKILIPGDSTVRQEKLWAHQMPPNLKGLVLGHHGSKTSTSKFLLDRLPNLKWAVSSARLQRYGHPHAETLQRLKAKKIPILRTEEWGNIHFQF